MVALPTAEKRNTWTDHVRDDVTRNEELGAERAVDESKFRKAGGGGGGGSSWADIAKETDGAAVVEAAKTAEAARSWDEVGADSSFGSLNFRLSNDKQVTAGSIHIVIRLL
jgi:hypothetical protein